MKKYQNLYVKREHLELNLNIVLKRTLLISLFAIGLSTMLFKAGIIDPSLFMTKTSLNADYPDYPNNAQDIYYSFSVLLGGMAIIMPIVAGLWAVGWTLEDAGAMSGFAFDPVPAY